ncbi:MAG: hypothetical protein II980_03220 [Clostridia bacterium]|nr:hypothetical protein [Clostridia bacterium]
MEHDKNDDKFIEKKVYIFSVFLLALIILMSVTICYFLLSNKILSINSESKENVIIVDKPIEELDENRILYEIKEYNGKIAVYKDNSLVYTLKTYVFTLPESDKERLKKGIIVENIEDLKKIIEEYN